MATTRHDPTLVASRTNHRGCVFNIGRTELSRNWDTKVGAYGLALTAPIWKLLKRSRGRARNRMSNPVLSDAKSSVAERVPMLTTHFAGPRKDQSDSM